MSKRDCYEVLGVARDASAEQIKKSYRQLALKYHPDKNPGDKKSEEMFKEATEAYQILSNEESRAQYDRFGHAAFGPGSGFEGFSGFGGFADDIFGDIFGAFFGTSAGGRSGRSARRSGRDIQYSLKITLEEAARGVEKAIKVRKPVPCTPCGGTGAREGTSPETCKQCNGQGQVRFQQGFFTVSRPCSVCSGTGKFIKDPCPSCGGSKSVNKDKELLVKVPAGIDTGQQLKVRGEGEEITGGPSGDLYVEVTIEPHKTFRRQDADIICEVPMTYPQAVLGGEVEVPTLDGPIMMKIPAATESGKLFRLRGKGIVDLHTGKKGDQHVRVYIFVPSNLNDKQRELIEQLSKVEGKPTGAEERSFLDRVKDFFD